MLARLAALCFLLSAADALKCDKSGTVVQLVGANRVSTLSWGNAHGDCPAGLDHCAWMPLANIMSVATLRTLDAYTKDTTYWGNIFTPTTYNSYYGGMCVSQQDCTALKTTSAVSCDGTTPCCCTGEMCNTSSTLLSFASVLAIFAVTSFFSSL